LNLIFVRSVPDSKDEISTARNVFEPSSHWPIKKQPDAVNERRDQMISPAFAAVIARG